MGVAVVQHELVQRFCTPGEEMIQDTVRIKSLGMVLGVVIAPAKQGRQSAVDQHMPLGNNGGNFLRHKGKAVHDLAGLSHHIIVFLDCSGAGIVTLAGIAAQNQCTHDSFSFRASKRFISLINLGRL